MYKQIMDYSTDPSLIKIDVKREKVWCKWDKKPNLTKELFARWWFLIASTLFWVTILGVVSWVLKLNNIFYLYVYFAVIVFITYNKKLFLATQKFITTHIKYVNPLVYFKPYELLVVGNLRKKSIEKEMVYPPIMLCEWKATGDYKKHLSSIKFLNKKQKVKIGKKTYEIRVCKIKFYFSEIPKKGHLFLKLF